MSTVYYSCLDKRWDTESNFDLLKVTRDAALAILLTILTKQEVLPTFFKNNNLNLNDICCIERLTDIKNIIEELNNGNLILVSTHSNGYIYEHDQYIAITAYNKDEDTFILKDPYLYTTKYSDAIKKGLLKYKTSSGSSNLISSRDALIGFDIYLPRTTVENILTNLNFYSVSIHKKETPMYTMKVVTNSKVTVRKEPNERSSKVYNTYNDDIVNIFEINDDNYGRTEKGWIELSSLVLVEPVQKKVKEKTTIRKYPENGSQKLGRYDKNTDVFITKVITGWCRTNKGWIQSSILD